MTTVFNDLATSNEATSSRLENVSALGTTAMLCKLQGIMQWLVF